MKLEIGKCLLLSEIPSTFCREIFDRLTIENPKFLENEKMGRWQGETPRQLFFCRKGGGGWTVPRGFTGQLLALARKAGVPFVINDCRRTLPAVQFEFSGSLKPFQEEAVTSMLSKDFGTLAAPTGSGKTVMALKIVAERRQPALIVVHTKELMFQWIDRIETFLGIPHDDVGIIGDGRKIIGDKLTVAIVNSLYLIAPEVAPRIGFLVVDEAHRTPARTFTEAVGAFDCKYMLGLSATPWRRDGLSRLIFWHIGDVHHQVDQSLLVENGDILPAEVFFRETNFSPRADPSEEYGKVLSELCEDAGRNSLIVDDIIKEASNGGGVCLVLSDRKSHCDTLAIMLGRAGIAPDVLTGEVVNGKRKAIVERLNTGKVRVLVATGQLIGEGFDCRCLGTLFLTTPIKFDGRLVQYLGRVMRPAPGKDRPRVYDYVDQVGVLAWSARSRQRVYASYASKNS